ncbi:MAG: T9SS type A sorting domain-containing protein, partial [Chitinophagales bacterium]
TLDVSGMTHLHLDYWTANSTLLNAFLISDGPVETASSLSVPTSGWASVDIPLTAFSPVDLAALIQFKFDGSGDIYLDNIYFHKDGGNTGGGDGPTVAAPEPTHDAANVISVFSDTYTNVSVENLNPDWGQATVVTEELIDGNNTLVYKGLNYQGLQLEGSQDVSGMTHLHLDYWTANSTALNAFIISPGPVETPSVLAVPTSGWASVDIPLTDFAPVDLADIFQFKFDGNGDIYLDNIYFHRNIVSINNVSLEEVGAYVYPNPAQNNWTLKTDNVEMSLIRVFDMAGKQILTLNPENKSLAEIDASRLNEGLYFAQVTTPKGVFSVKLIKE